MLSLGMWEIVVIAAIALIVVGPDRLPHMMRWLGRTYGQVRRMSDEMRRAFVLEADRQDAEERYEKLAEQRQAMAKERKRLQEERAARDEAFASGDLPDEAIQPEDAEPVPYTDELPPSRPIHDAEPAEPVAKVAE